MMGQTVHRCHWLLLLKKVPCILPGSVVTYLRCDAIFSGDFVADFLLNLMEEHTACTKIE